MAVTTFRLLIFLGVLVFYTFLHRLHAVLFVWHFLVFYFTFTVFEVAALYAHFKKNG